MVRVPKTKKSDSRRQRIVRQLAAYSMAAGAVAVATNQAQGETVHVNLNATVNAGDTYTFGIQGSEFALSVSNFSDLRPYGSYGVVGRWGGRVNIAKTGGSSGDGVDSSPVSAGTSIDNNNGSRWSGSQQLAYRKFYMSSFIFKEADDNWFPSGNDSYLGLRFDTATGNKFGWLRLSIAKNPEADPTVAGGLASFTVAISDFAYENMADTPIIAGATGSASTPEPGTLGMLAMGALGMLAWKAYRRKQADAVA